MLLIHSSLKLFSLASPDPYFGMLFGLPQIDWGWIYIHCPRPFLAWTIPAGLILKFFVVRFITSFSWKKSIVADAAITFASSGIDVLAIPLTGLAVYGLGLLGHRDFARPWILMLFMVAMIRGALETSVLRRTFGQKVGKKGFWLLLCADVICLSIGIYGLGVYAHSHLGESYLLHRKVDVTRGNESALPQTHCLSRYDQRSHGIAGAYLVGD